MPKKKTDDDEDLIGTAPKAAPEGKNSVTAAEELLHFVERFEGLQRDKDAIAKDQKDVMAEAKGRGYDTKALRAIISERKKNAEDVQQYNSILELYRDILGMG